jgi:hypothetical protein
LQHPIVQGDRENPETDQWPFGEVFTAAPGIRALAAAFM